MINLNNIKKAVLFLFIFCAQSTGAFAINRSYIEVLDVSNNPNLKNLPQLGNLKRLDISNTQITSLNPVASVQDLTALGNTNLDQSTISKEKVWGIIRIGSFDDPMGRDDRGFNFWKEHRNGTLCDDSGLDYQGMPSCSSASASIIPPTAATVAPIAAPTVAVAPPVVIPPPPLLLPPLLFPPAPPLVVPVAVAPPPAAAAHPVVVAPHEIIGGVDVTQLTEQCGANSTVCNDKIRELKNRFKVVFVSFHDDNDRGFEECEITSINDENCPFFSYVEGFHPGVAHNVIIGDLMRAYAIISQFDHNWKAFTMDDLFTANGINTDRINANYKFVETAEAPKRTTLPLIPYTQLIQGLNLGDNRAVGNPAFAEFFHWLTSGPRMGIIATNLVYYDDEGAVPIHHRDAPTITEDLHKYLIIAMTNGTGIPATDAWRQEMSYKLLCAWKKFKDSPSFASNAPADYAGAIKDRIVAVAKELTHGGKHCPDAKRSAAANIFRFECSNEQDALLNGGLPSGIEGVIRRVEVNLKDSALNTAIEAHVRKQTKRYDDCITALTIPLAGLRTHRLPRLQPGNRLNDYFQVILNNSGMCLGGEWGQAPDGEYCINNDQCKDKDDLHFIGRANVAYSDATHFSIDSTVEDGGLLQGASRFMSDKETCKNLLWNKHASDYGLQHIDTPFSNNMVNYFPLPENNVQALYDPGKLASALDDANVDTGNYITIRLEIFKNLTDLLKGRDLPAGNGRIIIGRIITALLQHYRYIEPR
ncbi:MAG: hypothetical protein HQK53_06625 [Oligoflexia bacterium]|nr:hypothetical protein [Oligoflexia bacterium]